MREDTIKTDKIEQLVEEDMKQKEAGTDRASEGRMRRGKKGSSIVTPPGDRILDELENQSIDELDVQAALEGGGQPPGGRNKAGQAAAGMS